VWALGSDLVDKIGSDDSGFGAHGEFSGLEELEYRRNLQILCPECPLPRDEFDRIEKSPLSLCNAPPLFP